MLLLSSDEPDSFNILLATGYTNIVVYDACRDPVLAPATRKHRIHLQSNERSSSQKDGFHSGINQESLFALFQELIEGCYCRLEVAHSFS